MTGPSDGSIAGVYREFVPAETCPSCSAVVIGPDLDAVDMPPRAWIDTLPPQVWISRVKLVNDLNEYEHGCRHDRQWQQQYAFMGLT